VLSLSEACKTYEQKAIGWRRHLHMNPEPSYKEFKTVEFLKRELDAMGVPCENIEGTLSFAGIVEGAAPGEAVALRADMDALPVTEETDVSYKSQTDGLMHACGHDAHMAMLLGAAAVLNERRKSLQGTVYLCFQSAEEVGGGALEIAKYLQSKGGVGRAVSLHIWSSVPAGEIILLPGATMSGLFAFDVTFKGQGGHGSRPDLVKDPIKPACDLTLKISSIPSNFCDVMDHCVVHVCKVEGGVGYNIFPPAASIAGAARFFKQSSGDRIIAEIERMAKAVAEAYNVEADYKHTRVLPPVVNDKTAVEDAKKTVAKIPGLRVSDTAQPIAASDNMSLILDSFPGVYGFLGAMNEEKGINWQQHSPRFDIDEDVLSLGMEFMARSAEDFLARRGE
jgi:amidohydrolase